MLLSFLELVGVLGIAPAEDFPAKTDDLQNILFNMHHLINTYRPHQAREQLCIVMEEQLERVRRETEESLAAVERANEVVKEVERVGKEVERIENVEKERRVQEERGIGGIDRMEEMARRRDREAWDLILAVV